MRQPYLNAFGRDEEDAAKLAPDALAAEAALADRGRDLKRKLIMVVIMKPHWRWSGARVSAALRRPFTTAR